MPATSPPAWFKPTVNVVFFVLVVIIGAKLMTNRVKPAPPPNLAACNCAHESLQQIMDRQRQVEALMKKITDEMNALDPKEMYTAASYAGFRQKNMDIINKLNKDFDIPSTGDGGVTNPLDCKPVAPQGTSKCIQESFQAHENVHQRECLAFADRPINRFSDWKKAKTMVQFWQEDLEAYQAELDFLKAALTRATAPCPANYPGAESKADQQQRIAGATRRLTQHMAQRGTS